MVLAELEEIFCAHTWPENKSQKKNLKQLKHTLEIILNSLKFI